MEKVFWVENGDLNEVNSWLQKGGKVKMIVAVPEDSQYHSLAYIVVEFD